MNRLFLLLLLVVSSVAHSRNETQLILSELDNAIKHKQVYVVQKEEKIENIKRLLTPDISPLQEYHLNENLSKEYQKFKLDSAIHYANRNLEIARALHNEALSYAARIQLATLYSSSGKYRESEYLLRNIDRQALPTELLAAYYDAWYLFFRHYASNVQTSGYDSQIYQYGDSLLGQLKPGTSKYIITKAEKDISLKKYQVAQESLLELLHTTEADTPDYAMITYLLGYIHRHNDEMEAAVRYFALSARADLINSLKDNASMQILSSIFYDRGDINQAYKYVQSAIEDAVYCNVQFRTIQSSEFYTIINTAYLGKEAKQKSQLQRYLTLISVLSFFLIFAVVYVYRQMKKVSHIRAELHETNEKLRELNVEMSDANKQLNEKNELLSEANLIKEEYIAHFFDLCSAYISKLENYRKSLNKKANDRQLDELFRMLKSTRLVENELEELYSNFDTIFINLYPTFVEEFNALLIDEERVTPKPGELLNTELRIFALIRLGITDSVKIAAFLRYSLSTIYNYRTKARNKAAVSRDEFEKMVMRISSYPARRR
ncbi:MAG: DUF6377 domain-containing protein [Bacteroides sp.]|nr:DUF6377 domain-containing protein [Bacteroides sp.]